MVATTTASTGTNSCGACELGMPPVPLIHGPTSGASGTMGPGSPCTSATGEFSKVFIVLHDAAGDVPHSISLGPVSAVPSVWLPLLGRVVSIGAEVTSNGALVPCEFKSCNVVIIPVSSGMTVTSTSGGTTSSVNSIGVKTADE